jgi:hypothetical protein
MEIVNLVAMVNAGMGPTHVKKFLAGCNIPPIDDSTLRRKEKRLAPVIINAAEVSCERAREEEQEHTTPDGLEGSFDAGWQKRGSGRQYNSSTGKWLCVWHTWYLNHAFGLISKYVVIISCLWIHICVFKALTV